MNFINFIPFLKYNITNLNMLFMLLNNTKYIGYNIHKTISDIYYVLFYFDYDEGSFVKFRLNSNQMESFLIYLYAHKSNLFVSKVDQQLTKCFKEIYINTNTEELFPTDIFKHEYLLIQNTKELFEKTNSKFLKISIITNKKDYFEEDYKLTINTDNYQFETTIDYISLIYYIKELLKYIHIFYNLFELIIENKSRIRILVENNIIFPNSLKLIVSNNYIPLIYSKDRYLFITEDHPTLIFNNKKLAYKNIDLINIKISFIKHSYHEPFQQEYESFKEYSEQFKE